MRRRIRRLFDYLVNLYFIYILLHVEELGFCFQIAMRACVDEQMVNYEWPYNLCVF